MPLPTLSSLLSYLPTVSLAPLIPLPSNLQQRLVSFLLRKTLGGIVKGGLDSARIEADIRDGSFAINKVEIDQHVSRLSSQASLGDDWMGESRSESRLTYCGVNVSRRSHLFSNRPPLSLSFLERSPTSLPKSRTLSHNSL